MDEIALAKSSVKYAGWISMVEACQNSGLPVQLVPPYSVRIMGHLSDSEVETIANSITLP